MKVSITTPRAPRRAIPENLRPDTDINGRICHTPVRRTLDYGGGNGHRTAFRLADGTRRRLVTVVGTHLRAFDESSSGNFPLVVGATLPADYRCAAHFGTNRALAMTADGPVGIAMDSRGEITAGDLPGDYPAVRLRAVDSGTVSVAVGDRTLSRTYDNGSLSAADLRDIVGDYESAYCRLASRCAEAGVFMQPCIARCKYYDLQGRLIHVGPPVLLMHSSGIQLAEPAGLFSADRRTIGSYDITASVWSLAVDFDDRTDPRVASVGIYLTPLFHPYQPDAAGNAVLGRRDSTDAPFCRVSLPGRGDALSADMVDRAIARLDSIEFLFRTVPLPFGSGYGTLRFDAGADPDCAASMRRLRAALARRVTPAAREEVMCSVPHTFSAALCCTSSEAVAWSGLSAIRFAGYSPLELTVGNEEGDWRAIEVVRFADGAALVSRASFSGRVPSHIAPLMSYPAPDAVSIHLIIYAGGKNYRNDFALHPDASGRHAVWISPSLKPVPLAEASAVQEVEADVRTVDFPHTVAFAPLADPLDLRVFRRLAAPVTAMAPRGAGNESWDFGRVRFILGTRAGILSAVVDLDKAKLSLRTLDSRPVARADALVPDGRGTVYAVAGAEGALLAISPQGRVSAFDDADGYVAVGYDATRRELWALPPDGACHVYPLRFPDARYRRSAPVLTGFETVGGVSYGRSESATFVLGRELPSPVMVKFRRRIVFDGPPKAIRRVTLHMAAAELTAALAVTAMAFDRNAAPVRSAAVEGAVVAPLIIPCLFRPTRAIEITFAGTVSNDCVIGGISID